MPYGSSISVFIVWATSILSSLIRAFGLPGAYSEFCSERLIFNLSISSKEICLFSVVFMSSSFK